MKVAVTGGLACGKTSVCKFLKKLGAVYVDADKIVHELLLTKQIRDQTSVLFGTGVLKEGQIDRKALAKRVFADKEALEKLEHLLHKRVLQEIERRYQDLKKASLFVAEVPLLFEAGQEAFFDKVIAVIADVPRCKERIRPPDDYEQRTRYQLGINEKANKADFVIENNGTLPELELQVTKLYRGELKNL